MKNNKTKNKPVSIHRSNNRVAKSYLSTLFIWIPFWIIYSASPIIALFLTLYWASDIATAIFGSILLGFFYLIIFIPKIINGVKCIIKSVDTNSRMSIKSFFVYERCYYAWVRKFCKSPQISDYDRGLRDGSIFWSN